MFSNKLIESIKETATNFPDRVAVIEAETSKEINYHDFYQNILNYAESINKKGFGSGDKVLILSPASIELISFLLGCSIVGVVGVFADPAMGREVLLSRIKQVSPSAIIVPDIIKSLIRLGLYSIARKLIGFELPDLHKVDYQIIHSIKEFKKNIKDVKNVKDRNDRNILEKVDENRDFVIVFTSGTTSLPKAVVHSERSINGLISKVESLIDKDIQVVYSDQPYITFPALSLGRTSVMSTKANPIGPKKFDELITKYKIDSFFTNPFRINILTNYYLEKGTKFNKNLKSVYIGSAPVTTRLLQKIKGIADQNTRFYSVYGMTEILPVSITSLEEKLAMGEVQGDYLGKIHPDIRTKLGEDSELLLGGDIFKNYYGEDPLDWFSTGDIVEIKGDKLFLKSRKKDMIIVDAYNIYPNLYENIIDKISFVEQSAMVGVYDQILENEVIYLFVKVKREHSDETKKQLFELLKNGKFSIDKYAIPKEIIFLKNLPVVGRSSKLDKVKLRRLAKEYYEKN